MSSRLIISPTFDLHLALSLPCTLIRKSCEIHLTKLFAHVHCVSLDPDLCVNTHRAGASCTSAVVPLPPDRLEPVSSFASAQISTPILGFYCMWQGRCDVASGAARGFMYCDCPLENRFTSFRSLTPQSLIFASLVLLPFV